jgi:hypothetical protein
MSEPEVLEGERCDSSPVLPFNSKLLRPAEAFPAEEEHWAEKLDAKLVVLIAAPPIDAWLTQSEYGTS